MAPRRRSMQITAVLVDRDERPVPDARVHVVTVDVEGQDVRLADGVSDRLGKVALDIALQSTRPPRVTLLGTLGTQEVAVADIPESLSASRCDFGTIVVGAEPLYTIGRRTFHGMNLSAWKATFAKHASLVAQLAAAHNDLAAALGRIQALQAELAQYQGEAAPVAVQELFVSVGSQLEQAQSRLTEGASDFRIGAVTMSLKGVPSADGTRIHFLPRQAMSGLDPGHISVVNLEFVPSAGVAAAGSASVRVPDVTGYTRTMALRKLADVGLYGDVSYQLVDAGADGSSSVGRVVGQLPAAGTSVATGTRIQLFIGKS